MKLKRAIGIGLVLYAVTFIVGVILTLVGSANFSSPQEIPRIYWLTTIIVTVLLTGLASIWYFKGKNVKRTVKEGFFLGIAFIVLGFIIDILLFIPALLSQNGLQVVIDYYTEPAFYITLVLVLATTIFVGSRK